MTQVQTGATFRKGRLLRSAATSAFALSALAGGVVLSGGEAKADNCVSFFDTILNTNFQDCLTVLSNPAGTANLIRLPGPDNMYSYSQTSIDWDGNGQRTQTSIYKVDKDPASPTAWFDKVQFRIFQNANNDQSGTKTIYSDAALTNQIAQIVIPTGGTFGSVALPNNYSTIYIKDDYVKTAHANNDLRNVPGPLPILGAGAAFGFSRKLRGRIKAASNA